MVKSISASHHKLRMYSVFAVLLVMFGSSLFIISMRAFGCGGPATYDLDTPMHSLDQLFEQLLTSVDAYDVVTRDEFLFLYPFRLEKPKEINPLWTMVYTYKAPAFSPPSSELFTSAIRNGDWKGAEGEAIRIVNQVLDMPAVVADKYQLQFIQALEFLEVRPLFQKINPALIKSALWHSSSAAENRKFPSELQDVLEVRNLDRQKVDEIIKAKPHHPRIATLRFVSLRNEFARKIPDGWPDDIRKKVRKETWREFEQSVDLWLKDYPQHPLADLVLLWKLRVYYFEGNNQLAWKLLMSVYPRRLLRVLYEMRYLLLHGSYPNGSLDTIKDPLLFTAVLHSVNIDSEQWGRWWQVSEQYRSHAWATNLQERLLEKSIHEARLGKLPPLFPKEPRNSTPLWGKLRALALMEAGQWDDAGKQLFSLSPDGEQAILAAAYHLRRGKTALAVQIIDLPEHIRHYLIRVILNDEALRGLTTSKNRIVRQEALIEQGVRLAEKGKWAEAAICIQTIDAAHAELWKRAAMLSKETSAAGRLHWARFLRDNNGKLFYGNDSAWYRSVNFRYRHIIRDQQEVVKRPRETTQQNNAKNGGGNITRSSSDALPWTQQQEQDAIMQHLTRTAEMWSALRAYVEWLSTAKPSQQMSAVVREADVCYNWLINWDSTNSDFWENYLRDHPVVKQLRDAGKRSKNIAEEKRHPIS